MTECAFTTGLEQKKGREKNIVNTSIFRLEDTRKK